MLCVRDIVVINKYNNFEKAKSNFVDGNTIDKIEKIRAENNKNWMNLLRLAIKYAPKEANGIFIKITDCDKKINDLMKEMVTNDDTQSNIQR